MQIIVSEIPDNGLEYELDIPVALLNEAVRNTVHVYIEIQKFGDKVLVKGNAKTKLQVACSRCLKESPYPLDISFDIEYIPLAEFSDIDEHELRKTELDISFYKDDEISIEELIKEQLLLAVPMKPLCSPDCKGICPECGKDLNDGACECKTEKIDPRLAVLKKLKK
ncbi:MAG: DUF177 domain-containing protein [Nitrospirae bacterium]|nr:DUF177 domain-containing protein [Nitrospirota bacterium]